MALSFSTGSSLPLEDMDQLSPPFPSLPSFQSCCPRGLMKVLALALREKSWPSLAKAKAFPPRPRPHDCCLCYALPTLSHSQCHMTVCQGAKFVLITNRKSHMSFRLVPNSVTLNGVIALTAVYTKFGSFRDGLRETG